MLGFDQALAQRFVPHPSRVDAASIVPYLDVQLGVLLEGSQFDETLGGLARLQPTLWFLDPVVDGIANHVGERVGDGLDDRAVDFDLPALDLEADLFADASAQLGWLSNAHGAEKFTRAMLCMEEGESVQDDVADAVCEMANMLAGLVKRRLSSRFTDLRVGLPLYVSRELQLPAGTASCTLHARVDDTPLFLVVIAPSLQT